MPRTDEFFEFARKRHQIYLDRRDGRPYPWTDDPILSKYSFTNVFRELDKTTVWFRENVRDPMRSQPEVLLATVVFRWFNRISTGQAIFQSGAWERFLDTGDVTDIKSALPPEGPYVTGAYIIKTPDGMSKVDGVLWAISQFVHTSNSKHYAYALADGRHTLEQTHRYIKQFPYLGDFMAYEVVTDLRHTDLLNRAPDILTWANAGPGAKRGLNRLHGRNFQEGRGDWLREMRELLAESSKHGFDGSSPDWPAMEMREIEHTLCEFDKYERVRLGQGAPRGRFKYAG